MKTTYRMLSSVRLCEQCHTLHHYAPLSVDFVVGLIWLQCPCGNSIAVAPEELAEPDDMDCHIQENCDEDPGYM
jgi:hypothetical protein